MLKSLAPIRAKLLRYCFGRFYEECHKYPKSGVGEFVLLPHNLTKMTKHRSRKAANMTMTQRERSRSPTHRLAEEDVDEIESTLNADLDIETLDEPGSANRLMEAYVKAQEESSNIWLDYANKSCYIYLYRGGGKPSESMAGFDLDGTLIKPKSNKKIPRSATDWDLFSVWTKVKLQQAISENDARFVVFTNQNGVGLNIVPLRQVQERIELVLQKLNIPATVFMAVEKDEFRKPGTAMFQLFNKFFNSSLKLNYDKSFYCGDAVGYPSHSDADIKFAEKLGLPFLAPDKFLRGVKPKLVTSK